LRALRLTREISKISEGT